MYRSACRILRLCTIILLAIVMLGSQLQYGQAAYADSGGEGFAAPPPTDVTESTSYISDFISESETESETVNSATYEDAGSEPPILPPPSPSEGGDSETYVSGRLLDNSGNPMPYADIFIMSEGDIPQYYHAVTVADGTFGISLPDGKYQLAFAIYRVYDYVTGNTSISKFIVSDRSFEVSSGNPVNLEDWIEGTLARLQIDVVAGGQAVDRDSILLSLPGQNRYYGIPASTDGSGRTQTWVTPGAYGLMISQFAQFDTYFGTITVPEAGLWDQVVEMQQFANIYSGRVLNHEGQPVSAEVQLYDTAGGYVRNAVTNDPATGGFVLGSNYNDLPLQIKPLLIENGDGLKTGYIYRTVLIADPDHTGEHHLTDIIVEEGTVYAGNFVEGFSPAAYIDYQLYDTQLNQALFYLRGEYNGQFQFVLPDDADTANLALRIELNAGNTTEIPLPPAGQDNIIDIGSGQLLSGLTGLVTNMNGNSLAHLVHVSFYRKQENGEYDAVPAAETDTDWSGTYRAWLSPGLYKVVFQSAGYLTQVEEDILVGEGVAELSRSLMPESVLDSNVQGMIVDANGIPVGNYEVMFTREDDINERYRTTTNRDGSFYAQLPNFRLKLSSVYNGNPAEGEPIPLYALDIPVDLAANDKKDLGLIQLPPTVPFEGKITLDGNPHPSHVFAGIEGYGISHGFEALQHGYIHMAVTPGTYSILVDSTSRTKRANATVAVSADGLTDYELPLPAAMYGLQGAVRTAEGNYVSTRVELRDAEDQVIDSNYARYDYNAKVSRFEIGSDESHVQLRLMPTSLYGPSGELIHYLPIIRDLAFEEEGVIDLDDMLLEPAHAYTGRILSNGSPKRYVQFDIYDPDEDRIVSAGETDGSGNFEVLAPLDNTAGLLLRVDGHSFPFPSSGYVFGDLALPTVLTSFDGSISLYDSSASLAGFPVRLYANSTYSHMMQSDINGLYAAYETVTDENGHFHFDNVPEDTYAIAIDGYPYNNFRYDYGVTLPMAWEPNYYLSPNFKGDMAPVAADRVRLQAQAFHTDGTALISLFGYSAYVVGPDGQVHMPMTDEHGLINLDLPPGNYTYKGTIGGTSYLSANQEIELTESDLGTTRQITILPDNTAGYHDVRFQLLDAQTHTPVQGARVEFSLPGSDVILFEADSYSDGILSAALSEGDYELRIGANDSYPQQSQILRISSDNADENIPFYLSAYPYQIEGTVVDDAGVGMDGAEILVYKTDAGGQFVKVNQSVTAADGSFRIGAAEAGDYRILIRAVPNFNYMMHLTASLDGIEPTVNLGNITMKAGGIHSHIGQIYGADVGEPIDMYITDANGQLIGVMAAARNSQFQLFLGEEDEGPYSLIIPETDVSYSKVITFEQSDHDLSNILLVGKDGVSMNGYFGVVTDANNRPINGLTITYRKFEAGTYGIPWQTITNRYGEFTLQLFEAGNYRITSATYNGTTFPLEGEFYYAGSGQLQVEGSFVQMLTLQLPPPSLKAVISIGGETANRGTAAIFQHLDETDVNGLPIQSSVAVSNTEGGLEAYLPPGQYQLIQIGLNGSWVSVADQTEPFEVVVGQTLERSFDLQWQPNVSVKVYSDGAPAPDAKGQYTVNIREKNNGERYAALTDSHAAADLILPPGEYYIYSIESGDPYSQVKTDKRLQLSLQAFTVTDSGSSEQPLEVIASLHHANVFGTAFDRNGVPMKNAFLTIAINDTATGMPTDDRLSVQSTAAGDFEVYLPDGSYTIMRLEYFDEATSHYRQMNHSQILTVSDGQPIDGSGQSLSTVTVRESAATFTGALMRSGGTSPWANVDAVFLPKDKLHSDTPWLYEVYARTNSQGRYEITLPDGTYVLTAIASSTNWYDNLLQSEVQIAAGKVIHVGAEFNTDWSGDIPHLTFVMQQANVIGQLYTNLFEDGEPLTTGAGGEAAMAWVHVVKLAAGTDGAGSSTSAQVQDYSAEAAPDGSFQLHLADTGAYLLKSVSMEMPSGEWRNWEIGKPFTVPYAGMTVDLGAIGPNIRGVAKLDGEPLAGGTIVVHAKGSDGSADKWVQTDAGGSFRFYLDFSSSPVSVEYEITHFYQAGAQYEIQDYSFTLSGVATDIGEVAINANVRGVVLDRTGEPLADSAISIQRDDGAGGANRWYNVRTDAEGRFRLLLEDGQYSINGFYDADNSFTIAWYKFAVSDGNMTTTGGDPQPLDQIALAPNLKIIAKETIGTDSELNQAWVGIKRLGAWPEGANDTLSGNTGVAGSFYAALQPGEYRIANYGSAQFQGQSDMPFTVAANGTLVIDETYSAHLPDDRTLIVAMPDPNVFGLAHTDKGLPAANGWVGVRNADSSYYRWLTTDSEGKFAGRLDDGSYTVFSVSTRDSWIDMNVDFSVENGTITGMAVVDGILRVQPPISNFNGLVQDVSGTALINGLLAIKPLADGENDWTHAVWIGTDSHGSFSHYLPEGDYITAQAGGSTAGNDEYIWLEPRVKFQVDAAGQLRDAEGQPIAALVVAPRASNMSGILYRNRVGEGDQNAAVANGNVGIVRVDQADHTLVLKADGTPALAEGTGLPLTLSDRDGIWPYTTWLFTDGEGRFHSRLEEGTYYVLSAGGASLWFEPGTIFETSDTGQMTEVALRPPVDSFHGTVTGLLQDQLDKTANASYWLYVSVDREGSSKTQWALPILDDQDEATDGIGNFRVNLPPGDYVINGIGTPSGYAALQDNQLADSSRSFTINAGGVMSVDKQIAMARIVKGVARLNGATPEAIVTLKIVIRDIDDSDGHIDDDIIKLVQTDEKGNFSIMVDAGHSYDVEQIITDAFLPVVQDAIDITFAADQIWTVDYAPQP